MSSELWAASITGTYAVGIVATWLWLVWNDRGKDEEIVFAIAWPVVWIVGAFVVVNDGLCDLAEHVREYRDKRRERKLDRNCSATVEPPYPFPPPPPLRSEKNDESGRSA